jgi:hypothetical protein
VTRLRLLKLDRVLSADGELQPVLAKARDLRALAGLVERFLSADLAQKVRVANAKDGQLTLIAANSAVAAKLRLLAPALSGFLHEGRFQVNSVSVRVQPNTTTTTAPKLQKAVHFSTNALHSLRALYERLPDSPVREALGRMLQRHGALRGP